MIEYLEAFFYLSQRRTVGFSAENPISTADIAAYLQLFPTDNVHLFTYLIGEMDSEYLEKRYAKAKTKVDKTKGKPAVQNEEMKGNNF